MKSCISRGLPLNVNQQSQISSLLPRTRLISSLLSKRDGLRVICAPPQFGKTTLAHLYASEVFTADLIRWIEASDPSFLISLDAIASEEGLMELPAASSGHQDTLLYVIDACPIIGKDRKDVLRRIIRSLLGLGHEVILTTRDTTWIDERIASSCIDAHDLLLEPEEQLAWLDSRKGTSSEDSAHKSRVDLFAAAIPGIYCKDTNVGAGLLKIIGEMPVETEEEALALIALVFGTGSIREIDRFAHRWNLSTALHLERRYPFCGVDRIEMMFRAIVLSEDQRFKLLRMHLPAMASRLSNFKSEESLVETLVAALANRGQEVLAARLICFIQDGKKRERFFSDHGADLFLSGHLPTFILLATSLSDSFLSSGYRWAMLSFALLQLGQRDRALKIHQEHGVLCSEGKNDKDRIRGHLDAFAHHLIRLFDNEVSIEDLCSIVEHCDSFSIDASKDWPHGNDRPNFMPELMKLVSSTIKDCSEGRMQLERIFSTGHSVKESLFASCVFAQIAQVIALLLREDNFVISHNALRIVQPKERIADALSEFETSLSYVLQRSSEVLPPNIFEAFLFKKAMQFYGDRAFVVVGDESLARVRKIDSLMDSHKDQSDAAESKAPESQMRSSFHRPVQSSKKRVRINLLGRFEVVALDSDVRIDNNVRNQLRQFISLLAISKGQEVSRTWLQQVMWPDSPFEKGRQSLYSTWSKLKRSIVDKNGDCPFFETFPQSYGINRSLIELDIDMLELWSKRLRASSSSIEEYEFAIGEIEELYAGELIPGDETPAIVSRRKSLKDHLIEALLFAGDDLRKQGQTNLALKYIQLAFEIEKTREDVCILLMTLLWKLDRHAEALSAFIVCQRALRDEIGISASPRLKELYSKILEEVS